MRKRMVAYMETIPGFATLGAMPWYPGKTFPGVIAQAQAAIRSRDGGGSATEPRQRHA